MTNGLRERSRSGTARARVCPQHSPGEDSREGASCGTLLNGPDRNLALICCRYLGPVSAAGARLARAHKSFPLVQDRPYCAGPRNFFGFRDAPPSGKRSVHLPVRRNGCRSLLRAPRNVEIRTFFHCPEPPDLAAVTSGRLSLRTSSCTRQLVAGEGREGLALEGSQLCTRNQPSTSVTSLGPIPLVAKVFQQAP